MSDMIRFFTSEISRKEYKMNNLIIEKAVGLIEVQQAKVQDRSPQWMVGEQLKDICRREPGSAELIARDLQAEAMSITEAEKKIKGFADKNKKGSFSCVTPIEADRILRKFYGLPEPGAAHEPMPETVSAPPPPAGAGEARLSAKSAAERRFTGRAAQAMKPDNGIIDLMDFL